MIWNYNGFLRLIRNRGRLKNTKLLLFGETKSCINIQPEALRKQASGIRF